MRGNGNPVNAEWAVIRRPGTERMLPATVQYVGGGPCSQTTALRGKPCLHRVSLGKRGRHDRRVTKRSQFSGALYSYS
jgi:hypothetical protein